MRFFCAFLCLALAGSASAGVYNIGAEAAPWLDLPDSARSAAMGGASVSLADDVNAVSVNPAGLGNLAQQQVSLMDNAYVQESSLEHAAYGLGLPGAGGLAAAVDYMDYGSVPTYAVSGNQLVADGTLNPYGLSAELGFGRAFGGFSVGAGAKLVTENLGVGGSTSALGGDLGLLWRQDPSSGLSVGVAVQNFGGTLDGANLPTTVQAGLAWRVSVPGDRQGLSFAGDVSVPTADAASESLSLGGEYTGEDLWALRAGYRFVGNNGAGGASVGGGLKYRGLGLDYAFVNEGVLGDANQVSLTASF